MGSGPHFAKVNDQSSEFLKKNCYLSIGSVALSQVLHVALVDVSVLILQMNEHLGVIVMGLQASSDAFPEIVVKGPVLIEP